VIAFIRLERGRRNRDVVGMMTGVW